MKSASTWPTENCPVPSFLSPISSSFSSYIAASLPCLYFGILWIYVRRREIMKMRRPWITENCRIFSLPTLSFMLLHSLLHLGSFWFTT
ncbi:hypothetical protein QBC45DRAFT_424885 [Copromyces sp. CBS 386.78]|nr:hypothetical protein QBC45DRAFT_424885 [Copromyces sp. CBS 386.78]